MNLKEKEQSLKLAEHYFRDNNYSFAKQILEKVIKIDINNSKANELLAYIYGNSGEIDISFEMLNVACSQSDCSPEALYYLGSAQLKRGLFDQAIETFTKSILMGGEFFEALHDLATAQAHTGDLNAAINNYQKCLKFGNLSHELFYNIARIYDDLRRYDEAIAHYDKALEIKPDYVEGWTNKGVTLNDLRRYDEAIACYDKALEIKPDYAEAWSNKGNTLNELKRYDEAIACYENALIFNSDIDWTPGYLIHIKMKICSWNLFQKDIERLGEDIRLNKKSIPSFAALSLSDDPSLQKQSSKIFANDKYPPNSALGPIRKRSKSEKIRVAYFSADFKNHPVSFLTAELFELHDKNQFEVIAFSFGVDDKSAMRLRLTNAFSQFLDVCNMSDLQIAALSRDMGIDIAVDLGGHTANSRTGIFAYRAAPIQVSYIGYLGTLGADYFDYLLADKVIIPEGSREFYSEKIAYLQCYQANDRMRVIADKKFTRHELGLPKDGFIFCSLNNNYKILPDTFDGWIRILKAVEGSVLFLYAENQWVEGNLKKEAESRGFDSGRLMFGQHLPGDQYLARYRVCDLFLDTFPYNAGTTASDALWTGLPVLTMMGQSFASRVAASLLNSIGLPELITNTQEEYEALAIDLALNPNKLTNIKNKLANNRFTTPLFDTPLFTQNLEAAYSEMYERYQTDLEPDHIVIA
jgi:predicted O-linked N-acetylglucosamine transferase (SPINDLY family)